MNIVRCRHIADPTSKEYLFQTKKKLKKGEYVLLETKWGRQAAIVTTDSMEVKKEAMEYLTFDSPWSLPLKQIVGKMDVWKEEEKEACDNE